METYRTRGERAALRCALGDAAALCDALARDVAAENRGYGGPGPVTKLGLKLEADAVVYLIEEWDFDGMRSTIGSPNER